MKRLHYKNLFIIVLLLFAPKISNDVNAADHIYQEWKGGVFYYIHHEKEDEISFYATVIDCDSLMTSPIGASEIEVLEKTDVGSFGNCTVVAIGDNAFNNCSFLHEIKLPESIRYIGHGAFSGCTNLCRINIPESVGYIGGGAFTDCQNLKELNLPDNIKTIEFGTFFNCWSLENVNIPKNVTLIDDMAFYNCWSLENVNIPKNVTLINDMAFYNCSSLTEINIPENVNEIENGAFYGCDKLTRIKVYAPEPPGLNSAFDRTDITVYVPDESIDKYRNSYDWKDFNIRGLSYNDVESIELNKYYTTLERESEVQLIAKSLPEDADDKNVIWSSDNEEIATVDENGLVTAIGVGETVITATAHDGSGVKAECKITVEPKMVNSVSLNKSELTLRRFNSEQLYATVLPEYADNKTVIWSSGNEYIATVDENGVVMAVGEGETIIQATAADGSWNWGTCRVTVTSIPVESINLNQDRITLEKGLTAQLSATVLPEDADKLTVTWESDNENVATVDENGLVTAVGGGDAFITAWADDGSPVWATCLVHVPIHVSSIELNQHELTFDGTYGNFKLTATLLPENADYCTITWCSDNEEVATVDGHGLVTAVGEGTATITATANDGSGVSASCMVTVTFTNGIADVEASKVTVLAANGRITVSGKEPDDTVSVYDTGGRLLYQGEDDVIDVPRKAMYIVTVSGKSYKVVVQ